MANDFLNPPAPNDASQTVGSLAELCSPFQASAKSCLNAFVFTPADYNGDVPVVNFLGNLAATPLALDYPASVFNYTVTPNAPQDIFSPNLDPNHALDWNAALGPNQGTISSFQWDWTPGTGTNGSPTGVQGFIGEIIQWCTPGTPLNFNDTDAGVQRPAELGLAFGDPVPPGVYAIGGSGGQVVTVTISASGLRVGHPTGQFLYRDPADGNSNTITVRYDFSIPVGSVVFQNNGDDTTPPDGFTNFQTARVQTANYEVCFEPVNSGFGVYPFQIDYTEGVLPVNSENVQFTFTGTPVVNSQPASNITQTSADANGDADYIPTTEFIRTNYGPMGGPYTNPGSNVPGTNSVGQPLSQPLAGLTPGTQYCYVVEHIGSDGTTVLQTSPETCFTTLAPATVAPECNPATFIQFDQADLQGTVDGMAANDYAVIEYGTTPGGPYPTKSGATPGDTTVGQLIPPVPFSAGPLTPGTYYYRVGVYDDPGATTFLEASSECSFTIPSSTVDCGTASNPTATTIDITATAHNVLPNWIILWEFATTSGGPYTQAFGANGDGTPNQALNETFGVLAPNTTYFYRWTVYDEIANEVFASAECDSFTTTPDREAVCDPATSVDTDSATLNGTLSGLVPGDQYRFRYGTTPGGPYGTTLGPFPAVNGSVSAPTGDVLAPGTTYYYILEIWDGFNVQATSGECSFATAPPPLVDPCEAATNVTPFSATLNGTATNVPAGYTRRFRYGTAPGVYTNTVPAGVFSGASPEAYSANIAGLTPGTQYYYTSEVLDPGLNVVAESPVECTFVTQTLEEGGIVSWCGAFYDSGQCIFVPTNDGGYFYCAGAEAIDE